MPEVLILGAGVAGLSAAAEAGRKGREAVIFEARERWGGLLDHFFVEGFRFDRGVHFAFSNNEPYQDLLEKTPMKTHRPRAVNYEAGRWLKHPVQNNLYPLPVEEKIAAIKSFLARPGEAAGDDHADGEEDYASWLERQFGTYIAQRYPGRYTEKYWTVPAARLDTSWVGNRLYRPTLEEVLYGAMSDSTPDNYYLPRFYYPRRGGFRALLEPLRRGLEVRLQKEAVRVDPRRRRVSFSDGSREEYEFLVSTIPLPDLVAMLDEVPAAVVEAAAGLWATGAALVSLGYNHPDVSGGRLWFYIYDGDILPARAHAPHLKARDSVPPGHSALQLEIYFSRHRPLPAGKEELLERVSTAVEKMGLARRGDLAAGDCRLIDYANVVFERGMRKKRGLVLEHLAGLGILPAGRFGCWDYLWSDQSYLSGKEAAASLPVV